MVKVVTAQGNAISYSAGFNTIQLSPDDPPSGYTPVGIIGANIYLSGATRNLTGFEFSGGKAVIYCNMSAAGTGTANAKILYIRTASLG